MKHEREKTKECQRGSDSVCNFTCMSVHGATYKCTRSDLGVVDAMHPSSTKSNISVSGRRERESENFWEFCFPPCFMSPVTLMWRTAEPLPLLVYVALITTLVDTVQLRVNYKSSRSSVIHTKHENERDVANGFTAGVA